MNKNRGYSTIAFVSGKGGVGKTTLATNLAWLISTAPARVLLIDLDFQNLGCTGLIAAHYKLENSDALMLLRNQPEEKSEPPRLTQVTENLRFLPAALVVQEVEHRDAFLDVPEKVYQRLERLLNRLHQSHSIDCFVLDCHGGIDGPSIAAAGICDHTMVVTEADTVTFAGTLGLVDSYYDEYSHSERKPEIEYIVNRIPPKYKWKDLDRLYQAYLEKHLGRFTESKGILSYIPAESYLAESFGDYPFQVELAPSAWFTRKLQLILYSLFRDSHPKLLSKKVQKQFRRERYARKIRRRIISNEARNTRTVLTSYALASLYFILVIPLISTIYIAHNLFQSHEHQKTLGTIQTPVEDTLILSAIILGLLIAIYFVVGLFRITLYFRDKFKFHKAIFRVLPKEQTFWRRLTLWKLRALYYGSALGPVVGILYSVWLLGYAFAFFFFPAFWR